LSSDIEVIYFFLSLIYRDWQRVRWRPGRNDNSWYDDHGHGASNKHGCIKWLWTRFTIDYFSTNGGVSFLDIDD